MIWSEITIIVMLVLGLLTWVLLASAQRLDRVHRKVVASRLALDAQLLRRSNAAAELATAGVLDPVSTLLLADSVHAVMGTTQDGDQELVVAVPDLQELVGLHRDEAARTGPSRTSVIQALDGSLGGNREAGESTLTAVLRELFDSEQDTAELYADPESAALLNALTAAWYRVQLARRFHNEAVLQAQRVRANPFVRFFRIAGHAAMPATVEFDDAWPTGLRQIAAPSGESTAQSTAESGK